MLKSGRRLTSFSPIPFLASFLQRYFGTNFGITFMFKIVKKSNYAYRDDETPHSPWASVVRHISCPFFIYKVSY